MLLSTLLLAAGPALACSMRLPPPALGLPGPRAGPEAVFSAEAGATLMFGDTEVAVTRVPFNLYATWELELLVPDEPLAPGDYVLSPCGNGEESCVTTIEEGLGDPGVAPEPPTLTTAPTRIASGQNANCGPNVGATIVTAESDAPNVFLALEPFESLDGAGFVGIFSTEAEGRVEWTTARDGDIFAMAMDAEGELSEWTPLTLTPGCSTTGRGPLGIVALLAAAGLARSRGHGAR